MASLDDGDGDLLQQLHADMSFPGVGDLIGDNCTHQKRAVVAEAQAKKRQR